LSKDEAKNSCFSAACLGRATSIGAHAGETQIIEQLSAKARLQLGKYEIREV
jgi:hypothetical protein